MATCWIDYNVTGVWFTIIGYFDQYIWPLSPPQDLTMGSLSIPYFELLRVSPICGPQVVTFQVGDGHYWCSHTSLSSGNCPTQTLQIVPKLGNPQDGWRIGLAYLFQLNVEQPLYDHGHLANWQAHFHDCTTDFKELLIHYLHKDWNFYLRWSWCISVYSNISVMQNYYKFTNYNMIFLFLVVSM